MRNTSPINTEKNNTIKTYSDLKSLSELELVSLNPADLYNLSGKELPEQDWKILVSKILHLDHQQILSRKTKKLASNGCEVALLKGSLVSINLGKTQERKVPEFEGEKICLVRKTVEPEKCEIFGNHLAVPEARTTLCELANGEMVEVLPIEAGRFPNKCLFRALILSMQAECHKQHY